jgi:hypothetical protein
MFFKVKYYEYNKESNDVIEYIEEKIADPESNV